MRKQVETWDLDFLKIQGTNVLPSVHIQSKLTPPISSNFNVSKNHWEGKLVKIHIPRHPLTQGLIEYVWGGTSYSEFITISTGNSEPWDSWTTP